MGTLRQVYNYKEVDEALANQVASVENSVTQLSGLVGNAASVYYGTTDPVGDADLSVAWRANNEDLSLHDGDLYVNTVSNAMFLFQNSDGEFTWHAILRQQSGSDQYLQKNFGTGHEGRHLFVQPDGSVSVGTATSIIIGNQSGTKTFAISVDEDGGLVVSEVTDDE